MDRTLDKAPDAFRTISEVADDLDLPQHVLRFWETRFIQIRPMKRGGGRRFYRREDVELLRGIRHLLYGEGYTIRGVQRILKDHGVKFVQNVWQAGAPQPDKAGAEGEAAETAVETPPRARRLFGLLPSAPDEGDGAGTPAESSERRPPAVANPVREPAAAPLRGPASAGKAVARAPSPPPPGKGELKGDLARDDLRKLEATLHELEECRRLLDDALGTAP